MQNMYTKLARQAVESYILDNTTLQVPDWIPKDMLNNKAGIFICIKRDKELRGCIGTFLPTHPNIAEEIIGNAISAASADHRFFPITKKELNELKYSVDVLSEPEDVENADKELDPKRFGILVKSEQGIRTGLLLPDLEGIDTIEQQISIACQKAGIDVYEENFSIQRYTVTRYEEK